MNRFAFPLAFAGIVALSSGIATSYAQAPSDGKPAAGEKSPAANAVDESSAAKLRSLSKALSGKWLLNVKFEPAPGMGGGVSGSGEESWREAPGGIALMEEEHIPMPGGQAYLLGIIWWNSVTKNFQGMECNSQLPFTCDLKGALSDITITWDEHRFAIDEIETHNGKKTVWHEAWSNITPTSFLQTGDVTQPDGSTSRFMTIQGTRVKENATP